MKYLAHEILSVFALVVLLYTISVSANAEGLNADFDYQAGAEAPAYILLSTDDATMSVGVECNWKRHWNIDKARVAEDIAQNLFENNCAYQPEITDTAVYEFHVDDSSVFAFLKNSDVVVKGSDAEFAVIAFGSDEGTKVDVAIYPQDSTEAIAAGSFTIEDYSGSVPLSKEIVEQFGLGGYTFVASGDSFTYAFDFDVVDASWESVPASTVAETPETESGDSAEIGENPVASSLDNGMEHSASIVLENGDAVTVGYSPAGWDGAYMGSITRDGSTYSGGYNDGTGVITIGLPDTSVNININSGYVSFDSPAAINPGEAGLNASMQGHQSANIPMETITSILSGFGR